MRRLILLLFLIPVVSAQIEISEIMYDLEGTDAGREWIEIYNSGDEINISGWKFYEAETNHRLTSYQGDLVIENDEFAIIVNKPEEFLADNDFTGTIIDSSWQSLSNSGELLQILDGKDGNIISEVEYVAAEEGLTLQNIAGEWCSDEPTPGEPNECVEPEPEIVEPEIEVEESSEETVETVEEESTLHEIEEEVSIFIKEPTPKPTDKKLVELVYESENRGNIVIGFYLFILVSLILNIILVLKAK